MNANRREVEIIVQTERSLNSLLMASCRQGQGTKWYHPMIWGIWGSSVSIVVSKVFL